MSDDSYLEVSEDKEENQENKSNSSNNNEEEIFDSLNINTKKKTKQNKITVNNEDSAIEEVYASLSGVPQKKENEENNIKENIKNNYSIDNNSKSENENENEKDDKKNNDEENVNLGNSFSKISERDKYKNDINEENNKKEKEVVTPNTSIYNLSETLTKRSGKENNNINNIEITNKNITNNIYAIKSIKEKIYSTKAGEKIILNEDHYTTSLAYLKNKDLFYDIPSRYKKTKELQEIKKQLDDKKKEKINLAPNININEENGDTPFGNRNVNPNINDVLNNQIKRENLLKKIVQRKQKNRRKR